MDLKIVPRYHMDPLSPTLGQARSAQPAQPIQPSPGGPAQLAKPRPAQPSPASPAPPGQLCQASPGQASPFQHLFLTISVTRGALFRPRWTTFLKPEKTQTTF